MSSSIIRKMTPMECERVQGFPDEWTVPTPEAAETYGHRVSTTLDGTSSEGRSRLSSQSGSLGAFARWKDDPDEPDWEAPEHEQLEGLHLPE
jgi:hypothetical protein